MNKELREKLVEIWGLEESPDGEPDHILTRDETGEVLEGTDYSEEVDQTVALFEAEMKRVEREARIDELSYISVATRRDKDGVLLGSVGGRIKELENHE